MKKITAVVIALGIAGSLVACSPESDETTPAKPAVVKSQPKANETVEWCAKSRLVVGSLELPDDLFERAGYLLGVGEGLYQSGQGKKLDAPVKAALNTLHRAYQVGMDAAQIGNLSGVTSALEMNTQGINALNKACRSLGA
jgi:hypothetical protein